MNGRVLFNDSEPALRMTVDDRLSEQATLWIAPDTAWRHGKSNTSQPRIGVPSIKNGCITARPGPAKLASRNLAFGPLPSADVMQERSLSRIGLMKRL